MKRKIVYVVIMLSIFMFCACVSEKEEVPEVETEEPSITSIRIIPGFVEITDANTIEEIVELFKSKKYVERKPMDKGPLGVYNLDFFYSDGSCVGISMISNYLVTEEKAYTIDEDLVKEVTEYFYPETEKK